MREDEIVRLIGLYKTNNDISSRNKVIEYNIKLVSYLIGKRRWSNDAMQEGVIGMMRAIEKFDPEKGVKFSTYAAYWINTYVWKYAMKNKHLVKIGTTVNERHAYYNTHDCRKTMDRCTRGVVDRMKNPCKSLSDESMEDSYLDAEILVDLDGNPRAVKAGSKNGIMKNTNTQLIHTIVSETPSCEDNAIRAETILFLRYVFTQYPASGREREIMEAIMNNDSRGYYVRLAEKWGVTRQRVEQIQKKMLRKLQEFILINPPP